jgi:hypothetical protein
VVSVGTKDKDIRGKYKWQALKPLKDHYKKIEVIIKLSKKVLLWFWEKVIYNGNLYF